jgi:hypothetical protein
MKKREPRIYNEESRSNLCLKISSGKSSEVLSIAFPLQM